MPFPKKKTYRVHGDPISIRSGVAYDGQQDPLEQVAAELQAVRDWPIHMSPNHADFESALVAYADGLRVIADALDPT